MDLVSGTGIQDEARGRDRRHERLLIALRDVHRIGELGYGRVPQLPHTGPVSQAGAGAHEHNPQGALGVVYGKALGDKAAHGIAGDDGGFKVKSVQERCEVRKLGS